MHDDNYKYDYKVAYEAMKKTMNELLAEQEELKKENAKLREGFNNLKNCMVVLAQYVEMK